MRIIPTYLTFLFLYIRTSKPMYSISITIGVVDSLL